MERIIQDAERFADTPKTPMLPREILEAIKEMDSVGAFEEAQRASAQFNIAKQAVGGSGAFEELQRASAQFNIAKQAVGGSGAFEELQRSSAQFNIAKQDLGLAERMNVLRDMVGADSGIALVAKQIQNQQHSIEAMRLATQDLKLQRPHIPEALHLPPNPIHETNVRLEQIERRFEQMLDFAANSAEIANGIQAHSAEFLVKFEEAAGRNSRSAGRAIWLAGVAILIAIVMPLVQILYTELWRVPQDITSMEAVITDMQADITTLRQTQIEAADRITAALERPDQQLVETLEKIARTLSAALPAHVEETPASAE
jgi:hypothetical protein